MSNDISSQTDIEAAVFRRLLQHLDENKTVQNIDLMITADFCRNCLSKWYMEAAQQQGEDINYDQAREVIYKMPYSQWKAQHQLEATAEQMAIFNERRNKTT